MKAALFLTIRFKEENFYLPQGALTPDRRLMMALHRVAQPAIHPTLPRAGPGKIITVMLGENRKLI